MSLWNETLVASRLLEYELSTRLHARKLGESHGNAARGLMGRIAVLELPPPVLASAMDVPVLELQWLMYPHPLPPPQPLRSWTPGQARGDVCSASMRRCAASE